MPALGALPPLLRKKVEDAVQDDLYFTGYQAAAFNMVANLFAYSLIGAILVLLQGAGIYVVDARVGIALGFSFGVLEAAFRLLGGVLWYRGKQQEFILGACYTIPLTIANSVYTMMQKNQAHLRRSPFTTLWSDGSAVRWVDGRMAPLAERSGAWQ